MPNNPYDQQGPWLIEEIIYIVMIVLFVFLVMRK